MAAAVSIRVKRVYEPHSADDGARFLVDRLWPRGMKKGSLRLDAWLKDAAPSDALRRRFAHDPARWEEFQREYFAQLDAEPSVWEPLLSAAQQGAFTLLYAARDPEHNNAVALRRYLLAKAASSGRRKKGSRASSRT